ncbi:Aste57867_25092 [Aphanomyces stellatus]|uniref:Aste57867_25092 protein n=1 Tax=Aphanomyces stellatus TaxID=120398 RepID=A0A485LS86_9STRA|nr:hypothetical protein As57867_025014 [Aphanomyces stellatus]VFU01723.1 Aste57867_25092 [Aphanomyces stellatus]
MKATLCPICYETCYDPVKTRCGHAYCRPCLVQWTAEGHKTCPSCRAYVSQPKTDPTMATPSIGRYVAIHFLLGLHWLNPYGIRLAYYLGCHGFGLAALFYLLAMDGRYSGRSTWELFRDAVIILITASVTIQLLWSAGVYYTLDWTAVSFCIGFFVHVLYHRFVSPVRRNPFQQFGQSKPAAYLRRTSMPVVRATS